MIQPRPPSPAVIDPLTDDRWADFVATAPGAMIFHHPAWIGLIHRHYGFPVAAACLVDPDGSVVAGVPLASVRRPFAGRRLVAFPFSDACVPLGRSEHRPALARALDDLRREIGAPLEVRGPVSEGAWRVVGRHYHHSIPLAARVEEVEAGSRRSSLLRGLRRARREGLVAERRTDLSALDLFYALHLATRRRQGIPTQPQGFIRGLRALFAQESGFVLLVHRHGRAAAAAVFLHHGGVLTYKYGASDERLLGLRPNNLLFWDAIRWGCENGMREVDLGRTDLGHESLRAFKLAWGAEERILEYRGLGAVGRRRRGDGRGARILAAGLRRSPPITGRLVGEVLYRYAA